MRKPTNTAFILIELLIVTSMLAIIVTIVALLFGDIDRAWTLGTGTAHNNMSGQAALNMISEDLQYAVADDTLTFIIRQDRMGLASYGFTNSEICFVSLQHDSSDADRTAREMFYWVRTNSLGKYELVRGYHSVSNAANNCYWNRQWYKELTNGAGRPSASGVIAENIAGLRFVAPTNTSDAVCRDYFSGDYDNRLPQYLEIYLEILNERAVKKAANTSNYVNFVENNAKRYITRVHFQNRHGYKER